MMGRYGGESAVVGVRTRARAASIMAAKTSSSSSPSKKIKKVSKTSSYDSNRNTCSYQLRNRRRNLSVPETFAVRRNFTAEEPVVKVKEEEVANCSTSEVITTTTAITVNSEFPPSCFPSNINEEENDQSSSPNDVVMDRCVADPEVDNIGGEASSRNIDCHTKRTTEENETSLREEEARESNGQDYCSPKLPDVKSTVLIKVMPSDAEIEEFFAAAEKDLQKRFIDKYNFDIVKGVPLEGRYEWVPMKP